MTIEHFPPRDHQPRGNIKITLSADTSEAVFVPADNVGLEVVPTTGTVRFEQTSATEDDVLAGTATWFQWSTGDVSGPASSIVLGATAVRGVATGDAVLYVRW